MICCCAALLLSGCASIQTNTPTGANKPADISPEILKARLDHLAKLAQISQFALKGRLGVTTQKQGFSGGIHWQHAPVKDDIEVYSPLGGKVGSIVKDASGVTLTTQNGNSMTAQDAESLTEATMGFRLPLAGLSDWALGRPNQSKIEAETWDAQGRIATLKQDGWDMSFDNYAEQNGTALPKKIILKSEKVNLKLLVETWQLE